MSPGRSKLGNGKLIMKGVGDKQVMPHGQFIDRIRKSLYFGGGTMCEDMEISSPLAEYASELFSEPHKGHSLNRLNKVAAGNVRTSPCSLIMALIYLDRLNASDPNYVRRITPSELFIVSMMISTKFYCGHDEEIYLCDWAEDGNISGERLKELELEFLCAIDWNIYISNVEFFEKLENVETTLAQREGIKRGWLTYTELINLLPSFTIAKFLLNNITVMAVSYAASVMTIAGAFFIASQLTGNAFRRSDLSTTKNRTNIHTSTNDLLNIDPETANNNSKNSNNCTCSQLNVEEELRKLEAQYKEDSSLSELNQRNNENDGPLINYNQNFLISDSRVDIRVTGVSFWHNFKDNNRSKIEDICNDFSNCTKRIIWNILEHLQPDKTFAHLPFVWLKYI